MDERSSGAPPLESDQGEFYRRALRSTRWGSPEPNDDERSRLRAISALLAGCDLPERPQILDLGCGRGRLTRALSAQGEVVGMWDAWMKGRDWQQPVEQWITEDDLDEVVRLERVSERPATRI